MYQMILYCIFFFIWLLIVFGHKLRQRQKHFAMEDMDYTTNNNPSKVIFLKLKCIRKLKLHILLAKLHFPSVVRSDQIHISSFNEL